MFRTLKQKLKRRLVQKFNRLHPLAGWAAGPALNANFNKIYGVGAKVTSVAEHVTLFNLAAQSQGNVVEVGSYISMSSIIMASGFAAGSGRKLFAIDMFDRPQGFHAGDLDDQFFRELDQLSFTRKLVADCGLQDTIELLKGKSADFYNSLGQFGETGLVFIDGDHNEGPCRADAEAFHRLVRPGGFLVFHDFLSPRWPAVRPVAEQFLREHPDFAVVCVVDSMLVTRRRA
jgi:predicted O-methyltransferase YrrM